MLVVVDAHASSSVMIALLLNALLVNSLEDTAWYGGGDEHIMKAHSKHDAGRAWCDGGRAKKNGAPSASKDRPI